MSRSLATESAVKRFHEFCQKPLTLVYNEDTNQAAIQKPSTLDNQGMLKILDLLFIIVREYL